MRLVHLTSSRLFGGPERQMLELAKELAEEVETSFVSFSEGGLCRAFLGKVSENGFPTYCLEHDTPRLLAALRELRQYFDDLDDSVLCCHGYKANLLGLLAARRIGIPVMSVSRGWTAECWRVRLYEWLDRRVLRGMDKVICVSEGQAQKVRKAGVADEQVVVIHNAVRKARFQGPHIPKYRLHLESLFTSPPAKIIGAAGRLSPEKGFDILIDACSQLSAHGKLDLGVVLFGDGFLRNHLQQQINISGLTDTVFLASFTDQLDLYMPHFDLFVQSSHTEGLPNVLLEAAAAGVAVVATNVGGTAEVVVDGKTGLLVPPDNASALADGISRLLEDDTLRHDMQAVAPDHVARRFTFTRQADQYRTLIELLLNSAQLRYRRTVSP